MIDDEDDKPKLITLYPDDDDDKPKLFTRNPVVLTVSTVMAINILGYFAGHGDDQDYRQPPLSPPDTVLLSTGTSSSYVLNDAGAPMGIKWNPTIAISYNVERLTPSEGREATPITFDWEVEPGDTDT